MNRLSKLAKRTESFEEFMVEIQKWPKWYLEGHRPDNKQELKELWEEHHA